jgi:hypothetical protein
MKRYTLPLLLTCCLFLLSGKTKDNFHIVNNYKNTSRNQREYLKWDKIIKEKPIIPGDFADPSIIRVGDTYYATGTSSEWAPQKGINADSFGATTEIAGTR